MRQPRPCDPSAATCASCPTATTRTSSPHEPGTWNAEPGTGERCRTLQVARMATPRFLYLFNAPPPPLPSHRREAFSASATLHVMAFALLTAVPPTSQPIEAAIAVAYVPPEAIVTPSEEPAPSETPQEKTIAEETV